jgi:hypothetical protein
MSKAEQIRAALDAAAVGSVALGLDGQRPSVMLKYNARYWMSADDEKYDAEGIMSASWLSVSHIIPAAQLQQFSVGADSDG